MDFRTAPEDLEAGLVNQEELVMQILNLPCLYGIFQNTSRIFCLDVHNQETQEDLIVALVYSNLEIAVEAMQEFDVPPDWQIAQWSEIEDALDSCSRLAVDGVAFDGMPLEEHLSGLVLDSESLQELQKLCLLQ